MRVFLDGDVIPSAVLWPDGVSAACYRGAVVHEHTIVASDDVLDEIRQVTARTFPDRFG